MIKKFEKEFARYFNSAYAYSFWKGRVAFSAILAALEIKNNDEVILPGFTCVVVPNAIIYSGAKPIYVDIDPKTFNIDPNKIEEKITPKTRAIILQHSFGIPAEIDLILNIARKYNLKSIEDSAQCLSSLYKNKKVGTFADTSFFSTQWSKPFTTGIGGIAITNDPQIAAGLEKFQGQCVWPTLKEKIRLSIELLLHQTLFSSKTYWLALEGYRLLSKLRIFTGSSTQEELATEKPLDYEKRMSALQAKLGLKKLKKIDEINLHRQQIAQIYQQELKDFQSITIGSEKNVIFLRYPLLAKDKQGTLSKAKKQIIELGDWFLSPIHPNTTHLERVGYNLGDCPIAERVARHIINLPTHPDVNKKKAQRIIQFIKKESKPYYL
jgi:dTDP-4-amino-4,6-dideoxygalactose transaminase